MTSNIPCVTALIGFDEKVVVKILADETVTKIVVFDEDDDENRKEYEKIYAKYGDRVTLYEGSVPDHLEEYFKNRGAFHRMEILEKYKNIISIIDN
jgi:hypothetical protein